MELTNLTTKDVFLPIGTKVGVTVPASGTKDVDDLLRGDPAVTSAETAGLISVTAFSSASTSGVAQDEVSAAITSGLAMNVVPAPTAGPQPPIVHGLGYNPLVQILDSAGILVPGTSVVHPDVLTVVVDTTGVASPATILYR